VVDSPIWYHSEQQNNIVADGSWMPAGGATETGIKKDGPAADLFNMYRDVMVEGRV